METEGGENESFLLEFLENPPGVSFIQILTFLGEMLAFRIFGILERKTRPARFPSFKRVDVSLETIL